MSLWTNVTSNHWCWYFSSYSILLCFEGNKNQSVFSLGYERQTYTLSLIPPPKKKKKSLVSWGKIYLPSICRKSKLELRNFSAMKYQRIHVPKQLDVKSRKPASSDWEQWYKWNVSVHRIVFHSTIFFKH